MCNSALKARYIRPNSAKVAKGVQKCSFMLLYAKVTILTILTVLAVLNGGELVSGPGPGCHSCSTNSETGVRKDSLLPQSGILSVNTRAPRAKLTKVIKVVIFRVTRARVVFWSTSRLHPPQSRSSAIKGHFTRLLSN